jgi:hypothetical protein
MGRQPFEESRVAFSLVILMPILPFAVVALWSDCHAEVLVLALTLPVTAWLDAKARRYRAWFELVHLSRQAHQLADQAPQAGLAPVGPERERAHAESESALRRLLADTTWEPAAWEAAAREIDDQPIRTQHLANIGVLSAAVDYIEGRAWLATATLWRNELVGVGLGRRARLRLTFGLGAHTALVMAFAALLWVVYVIGIFFGECPGGWPFRTPTWCGDPTRYGLEAVALGSPFLIFVVAYYIRLWRDTSLSDG